LSTVASRTFRSTPSRDALDTWIAIVDLLTKGAARPARTELLAIGGVAASLIADQAPMNNAITVTCDGPRTRIYCLYDEDAIDGSGENEAAFGYDPLKGDWRVSLPCLADDLAWVQAALKKHSTRITARAIDESVKDAGGAEKAAASTLTLDPKGFLGS